MPVWFPALCLDSATIYGLGWDDRAVSALFSAVSSPSRLAQACLQGKQESEREREREKKCARASEARAWNWEQSLFLPYVGLPRWLRGKESTCGAGDASLIHESGRSSGGGNGQSLQYSCLGNPTDRGAWRATVCGVAKSQTRLRD